MCYPLTHLCRICFSPVRAEPICRGLCYVNLVQTPFVVDEYCSLHSGYADTLGAHTVDEAITHQEIGDNIIPNLHMHEFYSVQGFPELSAEFPTQLPTKLPADTNTPYAEDVSQFQVSYNTGTGGIGNAIVVKDETDEEMDWPPAATPTEENVVDSSWTQEIENAMLVEMSAIADAVQEDNPDIETNLNGEGNMPDVFKTGEIELWKDD